MILFDEIIFIHKGSGLLTLDEENMEVRTGTVVFLPRGMWNGLENTGSENILMTFGYSPAGFEGFFRDNGTLVGAKPNLELKKIMPLQGKNMEWCINEIDCNLFTDGLL